VRLNERLEIGDKEAHGFAELAVRQRTVGHPIVKCTLADSEFRSGFSLIEQAVALVNIMLGHARCGMSIQLQAKTAPAQLFKRRFEGKSNVDVRFSEQSEGKFAALRQI
jgi:hypothetical protein